MKYLYILLICLILFYVLTRFYEKYYSQENFDPSLVPVSSIITLAKVAQKIVDGNGTLTNPANLNIGTPSGTGNLFVTGNTTTVGNETVDGTLTVGSNTNVGGNLGVAGATNLSTLGVSGATNLSTLGVNGTTTLNTLGVNGATNLSTLGVSGATNLSTLGVSGATTLSNTLGVTGNTTIGGTLGVTGATTVGGTLGVSGNTTLNGATTLNGTTTFIKDTWHKSSDAHNRLHFGNNSHTYFGSGDAYIFRNPSDGNTVTIDSAGNISATGGLTSTMYSPITLTVTSDGMINGGKEFSLPGLGIYYLYWQCEYSAHNTSYTTSQNNGEWAVTMAVLNSNDGFHNATLSQRAGDGYGALYANGCVYDGTYHPILHSGYEKDKWTVRIMQKINFS